MLPATAARNAPTIPPTKRSGTSTAKCHRAMPTMIHTRTLMRPDARRAAARFPWAALPIGRPREVRHPLSVSLYWRVVAINAGGLVVAALILALTPATVSSRLTAAEAAVLAAGTLALIAVNVVLLRRMFRPLERLADVMRRVDLPDPDSRVELDRPVAEVADLYGSFNAML